MKLQKQPRLGEILLEKGLISSQQLALALDKQKTSGQRLGKILVDECIIGEEIVLDILETQLDIPQIKLGETKITPEVVKLIPETVARKYKALAYRKDGNQLFVAMSDPFNLIAIDDLMVITKCEISPCFALTDEIKRLINKYYGFQDVDTNIETGKEIEELKLKADEAPVIKYVNYIFNQAVKTRASDIHLEPQENDLRIRFRIDGILQAIATPPQEIQRLIVPRIKLMSNMNIAEKRVPQDGRIEITTENKGVDLRVSTLPTIDGEKIVIRVLDKSRFLININEMGFSDTNLDDFSDLIHQPFGMLLVTGPTGCGKTSTLYTALNQLNSVEKNIITVEDPVEYRLKGINQVHMNTKAGLTFASGLRSILRQDPNIIMIGEIRDGETADIAIRAALTGHLVLSTLHTNDAAGAITRLIDMGIEPFLVATSVIGVVAQRLVRIICPACKEPYVVDSDAPVRILLNVSPEDHLILYRGKGCSNCNRTGYLGRTAIHEILMIDSKIKELINEKKSSDVILDYAIKNGMKTLQQDGLGKALKGITTYQEVLRVSYSD